MGLSHCQPCKDHAKKNNYYVTAADGIVATPEECSVHPRLDNWRVYRTMATIQYYSNQGEGYRPKYGMPGMMPRPVPTPMTREAGWVHKRNLQLILFDYEMPMIDFLIEKDLVEQTEIVPRSVRLTPKGDEILASWVRNGRDKMTTKEMGAWVESWQDPLEEEYKVTESVAETINSMES